MCWIILPVVMEYEDAGDFTPRNKFKTSIMVNLKWYIMFSLIATPILILTYFSGALEKIRLTDLVVAISNSFGLVIVIVCLGYSLTTFPQSVLELKDLSTELGKC
jgi:LMBR1-like membrane protein